MSSELDVPQQDCTVTDVSSSVDSSGVDSSSVVATRTLTESAAIVEGLIFAQGSLIEKARIQSILDCDDDEFAQIIALIKERHSDAGAGFELVAVQDAYQFRTKASLAPFVRELKSGAPRRLSNPALETLAIIAYRQPIVRSDMEKIRGVDVTPTLKTLLERNLIKIVGHQSAVGQPALYGTTEEFLSLFGMQSLAELPTLRDLRELEKDPGEVDTEQEEPNTDSETTALVAEQQSA